MTATAQKTPAVAQTEPEKKPFSLLSDEKLIEIYTTMVKCRMLAERAGKRAIAGREAVLAGALLDLQGGDALALAVPDLLARFVLGATLNWVARKLSAKNFAVAMRGQQATAQEAVDEARAAKKRKAGEIVVAMLPEGWADQAAWRQAMRQAWKLGLPMIFVGSGAGKGFAPEFPVIPVDERDAVAIYRVASEASVRARKGGWSTLIECVTYAPEGVKAAKSADPVAKMEQYLRGKQIFKQGLKRQILVQFALELEVAGLPTSKG